MERALTTTPEYVFVFSATDELIAAQEGQPLRISIPRDVTDAIREHLRTLEPGETPDMSKFHLPDGIEMKVEQKTGPHQVIVAFEGQEVPRQFSRTENYVPEDLRLPAPWTAEMGQGDQRRLVQMSYGCADELNRRQGSWDWVDVSLEQDGSHWSHFDGHREQVDISVNTHNYHRSHDWKGYDDVRGTTRWTVAIDRIQVGEGSCRDPFEAMLQARDYAKRALRFGSCEHGPATLQTWRDADKLIGTGVWYRDQAAVVTGLVLDQGCVMIQPANAEHFEKDVRFGDDGFCDDPYERQNYKIEVMSKDLYWHRKTDDDLRKFVPREEQHA